MIGRRLVLVLLAVAAVLGALQWARTALIEQGRLLERGEARAHADELVRQARAAGRKQAEQTEADAKQAMDYAQTLKGDIRGKTLAVVACRPGAGRPDVVAGVRGDALGGPGLRLAPAGRPGDAPPPAEAVPGLDDGEPAVVVFTAGAVGLWNSALAGHAVAVGACGTAGAAAGACDAAAGVTLEDLWANHIDNAASCAADRARHRHLIEFLRQQQLVDEH